MQLTASLAPQLTARDEAYWAVLDAATVEHPPFGIIALAERLIGLTPLILLHHGYANATVLTVTRGTDGLDVSVKFYDDDYDRYREFSTSLVAFAQLVEDAR